SPQGGEFARPSVRPPTGASRGHSPLAVPDSPPYPRAGCQYRQYRRCLLVRHGASYSRPPTISSSRSSTAGRAAIFHAGVAAWRRERAAVLHVSGRPDRFGFTAVRALTSVAIHTRGGDVHQDVGPG